MLAREGVLAPRGGVAAPGPRRPEAGSPRKKLYLSASADRPAAPHAVTQHPVLLQVLFVSEFYVTIPHLSPAGITEPILCFRIKRNKIKPKHCPLNCRVLVLSFSSPCSLFSSPPCV